MRQADVRSRPTWASSCGAPAVTAQVMITWAQGHGQGVRVGGEASRACGGVADRRLYAPDSGVRPARCEDMRASRSQPSAAGGARARRRRVLAGTAVLAAILAAITLRPTDPLHVLEEHTPVALGLQRQPAPDLSPRLEHWKIPIAGGDTLTGLWRRSPGLDLGSTAKPYTCVLLGGLRTGEGAALLLPESLGVHVLALDWPWWGPHAMSPAQFVRALPAIRRAILRAPGVLAVGVELAAAQPEVDPARIVVVGASLGVPPAVAALRLTAKPRACALVHGAADLRAMLRYAVGKHVPQPLAALAAALAARWIRPLEPRLHADALRGVPFLIVNATDDDKLPRQAIEALHGAFPWATVQWMGGRHMRPTRGATIEALAHEIMAWLDGIDTATTRPLRALDDTMVSQACEPKAPGNPSSRAGQGN